MEEIRRLERERLRALVDGDLGALERLHAPDFQLVNPAGQPVSRDDYLGLLRSGQLAYVGWEAGEIAVRLHGNAAMIRYRDTRFDVDAGGRAIHRGPMVHTNLWERREGRWQVVWSQASGVITPP